MKIKDIKFSTLFVKMKLSDFLYSIVIILFFLGVVILFFYSMNFLLRNVNKIFSSGHVDDTQTLNLENYSLVEKKLNLPTYRKEEAPTTPQGTQQQFSTSTPVTNN